MKLEEIKQKVFRYYCKKEKPECQKCGYSDIRALCLDHMDGDGNLHRQEDNQARGINLYKKLYKNNFKSKYNFQVLCFNCNQIKITENKEYNYKKPEHWKLTISEIGKRQKQPVGKYAKRSKKVIQYTLDGIFVKEWDYIKEAESFYNSNINAKNIVACCNNKQKSAYGFIWKHSLTQTYK